MSEKKILTVDDSMIIRKVVAKCARAAGCDVVEASNGAECLEVAAKEKPDLIVLDVNMPVMNGDEALVKLRAMPETKDIPVLMLTTEARKEVVIELIKKGANQYIVKPFTEDVFFQKVNAILHLWEGEFSPQKAEAPSNEKPQESGDVVLVVADIANIVDQIQKALPRGRELKKAQTENDALLAAKKWHPGVILIDLRLEHAQPLHLFEELRKTCPPPATKYVGMCLRTAEDSAKAAKEAGLADILYKPFAEEEIAALLKSNSDSALPTLRTEKDLAIIALSDAEDEPKTKIDGAEFERMKDLINDAAEQGYTKISFDIKALSGLDIDSIKELIVLSRQCKSLQIKHAFANSDPGVKEKLAGVAEAQEIPWADDLDKAEAVLCG